MSLYNVLPYVCLSLALAGIASAQDEGGDGIYGYSSVYYDASSNTIVGYSETDLDPSLQIYYSPTVDAMLVDQNGNVLARGGGIVGDASVTLQVTATPGYTYTMEGGHSAQLAVQVDCGGPICNQWLDPYNFGYFSSAGVEAPDLYEFFGPGPQEEPDYNAIVLGETYSEAEAQAPTPCGDQRDTIIAEYQTYNVAYNPPCSAFAQTISDSYYTFSEMNTGDYSWAIIQPYFLSAMDTVYVNYLPNFFTINSAYRNPAKEYRTDQQQGVPFTRNSRHEYGDAVDIASNASTWQALHDIGKGASGCVEPQANSGVGHVHMDWRGTCPLGW